MSSRVRPRHCALLGAALALALAPLAGKAVLPGEGGQAAQAAIARAGAVHLGGGHPAEQSTQFVERLDGDAELGEVRITSPKGTREWSASAMSDHDVPMAAERGYRSAARALAGSDPTCGLPWTLLAGVGRVESDHGRYGGSTLGKDGVSHPLIIGVQLNGAGPVAAIRDSDDGKLDKDKVWDRAVGPMQFIPTTWAGSGRDGDGDGVESPNDLDDAALAAATYLCSGGGSVLGETAMAAAVLRYNQDAYYVALVMAFERGYRTGSFVMPTPPAPQEYDAARAGRNQDGNRHRDRNGHPARDQAVPPSRPKPPQGPSAGQGGANGPEPTPEPHKPSAHPKPPRPAPKPPTPPTPPKPPKPPSSGPHLVSLSGVFSACGSGWCLGATPLDLGPSGQLSASAEADFDGSGTTGTNAEEFSGMTGAHVVLLAEKGAVIVVYTINGKDYRLGDGSFA